MKEILYFTTPTCGPCKMFGPVIDEVSRETGVSIKKIDASTETYLVSKHRISGVPTVIFLRNDREVDRQTGITSKNQLLLKVKNL